MTSADRRAEGPPSGADEPAAIDLDTMLDRARRGLDRIDPIGAHAAQEAGALLVDIRPEPLRRNEGEIPGSAVIDRNVLEWRLAPSSAHRVEDLLADDPLVIIFCSEGYASSLAASSLRRIGVGRATDLDGGYRGWKAAGLPWAPIGAGDDRTAAPERQ